MARQYSSQAVATTLGADCTSSATTIVVSALIGFPSTTPFTITVDKDGDSPEIMDVTDVAGMSLTVTRHVDSSVATAHTAGDTVEHTATGRDFQEAADHIDQVAGVHGLEGNPVGDADEQTLTNKEISGDDNTITDLGTDSFADGSVTNAKLATGIDGSKLTGAISATTINGHKVFIQASTPTATAVNDIWVF